MADTQATKPKRRRWLSYSLRTLFIAMTVIGVGLGWKFERVRKQRRAVAAIKEVGGSVWYDYELDAAGNTIPNATPPGPASFRKLVGDDFFANVVRVHLYGTPVSDLSPLERLANLKELYLEGTQVTDLSLLEGLGAEACAFWLVILKLSSMANRSSE